MGAFYVGLYVLDVTPEALAERLGSLSDPGYVGRFGDRWTFLSTEALEHQDPETMDAYAEGISGHFGKIVLGVTNHDDDILMLDLYRGGECVAGFNSSPGYFDEDPKEDDLKPRWIDREEFLREWPELKPDDLLLVSGEEVFASEIHTKIARLFGLPSGSVGAGYKYIYRGDFGSTDWIVFGGAQPPSVS